jgi:hypothetical protein
LSGFFGTVVAVVDSAGSSGVESEFDAAVAVDGAACAAGEILGYARGGPGAVAYHASTRGTCEGANAEVPSVSSVPPQVPGCHAYATWDPPLPASWPVTGKYYELLGCDAHGFAIGGGFLCDSGCSDCQARVY